MIEFNPTTDELQRRCGKDLRKRALREGFKYKNISNLSRSELDKLAKKVEENPLNKRVICRKYCITFTEMRRYLRS